MIIDDKKLNEINGGANWKLFVGLGMLITMIVGIADGYLRPLKCN